MPDNFARQPPDNCPAFVRQNCPALVRQLSGKAKTLKNIEKPMVFQGFGLPDNGRTIAGQKPDNCRTIVWLLSGKVVRHLSGKATGMGAVLAKHLWNMILIIYNI